MIFFPLESGLVADIPKSKARYEQFLRFHWEFYSELVFLRSKIEDSLKSSLRERANRFPFSRWQRVVKYKYSLEPLSAKGSLVSPGGRFNIGEIDTTRFVVFPALYLASDKETALAEIFAQRDRQGQQLTVQELALTKPDSVTAVSVSGDLESVFDVREENNLIGFVNLIKDFRLSTALIKKARVLGLPSPKLVRTVAEMKQSLLAQNWRLWPLHFDVPNSSQIFGRIVLDARIEGIVYESVLTEKPCLALYPQNFENSSSFVELDDPVPSETVQKRIDSTTFRNFV